MLVDIFHINKYDMNLNVYNLQFVLKEKENGKTQNTETIYYDSI